MKKIAVLESKIDYLESELCHLNQMLMEFGFDEGIKTLAKALEEVSE